jgi:hypothetical protein
MLPNHITKPTGTNAPGIGTDILIAPKSWFSTIAVPPASETTPGANVLITEDHEFVVQSPTLGFVKMETTARSGSLKFEQTGDIDSYGINAVVEAWSPGINLALFSLMVQQDEFLVLVKDISCENVRYYQIGASCSLALKREWVFETGKAGGEGKKGTMIKFDAYMDRPLFYTGAVPLAEQPAES